MIVDGITVDGIAVGVIEDGINVDGTSVGVKVDGITVGDVGGKVGEDVGPK